MFTSVFLLLLAAPNFQETLRSGLTALNNNDLPQARAYLESAAKLDAQNSTVWIALAQTYRKLHQDQLASQSAARAEKLGMNDASALHALAIYYSQSGELIKSADMEARYASIAPADKDAPLRAMETFLRADKPTRAIEVAHAAPDWQRRADVRNVLGKAYALNGNREQSATELRAAFQLSPNDEAYLFDLANLFLRTEKFQDAVAVLLDGRRAFPDSAQIELALGVAYYGLRRFPEAIDQFLKTIAIAPGTDQPYTFLGKMLDQAGPRMPEIAKRFSEYEQVHPDSYLGYLLHAKELDIDGADPAQAEKLLEKSIALDGHQWESHSELALLLERRRAWDKAASELEQSVALNPAAPALHYRLARLYDRLGKPEAARAQRALHAELLSKAQGR